jgi:hypothetical protein
MPKRDNGSYDVGYGKPPKHSRFQPGQSGNARGRPPNRPSAASILERVISKKVTVTENGRHVQRSKLEVALTQVANKAASGDLGATALLFRMLPLLPQPLAAGPTPDLEASREMARKIMAQLVADLP